MIGFQRKSSRWLSLPIGLTLALIGTFSLVNSAQAADFPDPSATYDKWNAAQYDPCGSLDISGENGEAASSFGGNIGADNIASGNISVGGLITDGTSESEGVHSFDPAYCLTFSPVVLTNNASVPVEVSFWEFWDDGVAEPYYFEWMGDQNGDNGWKGTTILQPGQSTPEFAMTLGMPWDAPNGSESVTGSWWAKFKVVVAPIVQGVVWNDVNDDGVPGNDEPLLEGFTVSGQSSASYGTAIPSDTTDSSGAYSFGYAGGIVTITVDPTKWQPKWLIVNGEKIENAFSVSEDKTEYSYELPASESGTTTTFSIGLIDLNPDTKQSSDDNGGGDNGGSTEPGGSTDNGDTNPAATNATNPANPTDNTPSIDIETGGQVVNPSDWAGYAALAVSLAAGCVILATRRKALS